MTRSRKSQSRGNGRGKSRGDRNIAWIETHCRVPEGRFVGKPVELRLFQRELIRGIYDTPTRRAIISFGRKNAKTTMAAFLLLLHLCGPEARRNSELFSTALSRDQAAITFSLAAKMVRLSPTLADYVTIRDTAKQLMCPELGTLYRALSAEAPQAFGYSPVFLVHDELGQVAGERHQLYEAMETATAAQEAPLSIIISTQAPTDADLLSRLIDDAQGSSDPKVKLFLYTSDPEADPFDEETIRQANPAFGDFQNAEEVLAMAEDARRMPSREAAYRNLVLNQRVEVFQPFVPRSVWEANAGEPGPMRALYGGLDLSETGDLTALVLLSSAKDGISVFCRFWLPEEGLVERSRKDRVPYDVWRDQGHLHTTPGRAVEYGYVAEYLAKLLSEQDIRKIAFDRYNMKHLRPWLVKAGVSDDVIEHRFQEFGQGFVSMSPALRELETMLLNERIRHGGHPVLRMCALNSVVKMDEAGNRKLDKKRSRGRIDGLVAMAMAAGALSEDQHQRRVFPVEVERIVAQA